MNNYKTQTFWMGEFSRIVNDPCGSGIKGQYYANQNRLKITQYRKRLYEHQAEWKSKMKWENLDAMMLYCKRHAIIMVFEGSNYLVYDEGIWTVQLEEPVSKREAKQITSQYKLLDNPNYKYYKYQTNTELTARWNYTRFLTMGQLFYFPSTIQNQLRKTGRYGKEKAIITEWDLYIWHLRNKVAKIAIDKVFYKDIANIILKYYKTKKDLKWRVKERESIRNQLKVWLGDKCKIWADEHYTVVQPYKYTMMTTVIDRAEMFENDAKETQKSLLKERIAQWALDGLPFAVKLQAKIDATPLYGYQAIVRDYKLN